MRISPVLLCLRVLLVSVVAGLLTAAALRLGSGLAAATHGLIFGAGAVLFVISDVFFGRLLGELNNVLRSTGYSVWQAERLRAVILPFKTRAWLVWWVSQGLKVVSAVCAVVLQKQTMGAVAAERLLRSGYFSLFVALTCTIWLVRRFRQVEKFRDDLALEEVSLKETKRLASDLQAGAEHDFKADGTIQGYAKPPGT